VKTSVNADGNAPLNVRFGGKADIDSQHRDLQNSTSGAHKRAIAATKSFLDLGQRAEKTNRDALAAREVIVAAIYPFADYQRTSATSAFGTKQTSR
jgi:hypothetical protein